MAWSVLQSAVSAIGSATTIAATFSTANLSSGTKLIAFVGGNAYGAPVTPSTVKDGSNNSFTQVAVASGTTGVSPFYPNVSVWVMDTVAGQVGTKPTVTATFPAGIGGNWILLHEVSGLAAGTSASVDGTPGAFEGTINATSTAQPAYSSSASNELLYSLGCQDGINNALTQPAGYTLDANSPQPSANTQGQVAYKNSSGAAESGNWTTGSAPNGDAAFLVLAFKLPGAAAPPPVSLVAVNRPALIVSNSGWRGAGHSR